MTVGRRWPAFSVSLIGHIFAIGFIFLLDSASSPAPTHAAYRVVMVPPKPPKLDPRNVIWYEARKAVPVVTPKQAFGPSDKPTGTKDTSGPILISITPEPRSSTQLIRQSQRSEPLPVDVPAPNLVLVPTAVPARKPLPKPFVPPPTKPKVSTAKVSLDPAPALDAPQSLSTNNLGALASLMRLPRKAFVAPPRANTASVKPLRNPSVPEPPTVGSSVGPAALEAVIVGLNPAPASLPTGSRAGQFARAPDAGPPSSGASLPPGAVAVPDLMARGNTGRPGDAVPLPAAAVSERRVPKEIEFPGVNRTMSAPLRPSSRFIPAAVEAQFANRNVYTLVIPSPNLPEYHGDWVMWFAQRQIENDTGLRILAPVPARKYSAVDPDPPPSAAPSEATVQFAAIIDRNGRITSARILRSAAALTFRLMALAELETWEFRPALRNGEPIDVDIVVEIPLQLRLPLQGSK